MHIQNINDYTPSNKGSIVKNRLFETVYDNADRIDRRIFDNIHYIMSKKDDDFVFEIHSEIIKESTFDNFMNKFAKIRKKRLTLVCNRLFELPTIFNIGEDKYDERIRSFRKSCYDGALAKISKVLSFLYPKEHTIKNEDEILIKNDIKFIPEMFEEIEESVKEPVIHEDLYVFEDTFHDKEFFDNKIDINQKFYPTYSNDDVPLADNLKPYIRDVQYINLLNEPHSNHLDYGIDIPLRKKNPDNKYSLPSNAAQFGLEHIREYSVPEAFYLYELIKGLKINNAESLLAKCKSIIKQYDFITLVRLVNGATLYRIQDENKIRLKLNEELLDFLTKYRNCRDYVVSKNFVSEEVFDSYGAKFFDKLYAICLDLNKVKELYEKCKVKIQYSSCFKGTSIIHPNLAKDMLTMLKNNKS